MKTERELFLYELEGRGYTFENMTWLGNCFEDDSLNMVWEMWCASAQREGYKLVPIKCTNDMVHAAKEVDGRLSAFKYGDVWEAMINSIELK